jgi:hypothetical protein
MYMSLGCIVWNPQAYAWGSTGLSWSPTKYEGACCGVSVAGESFGLAAGVGSVGKNRLAITRN